MLTSEHESRVLSACASSTFALRLLRTHGLGSDQLHLVARATIVESVMYASPAWWWLAGVGDRLRFERLLARLRLSAPRVSQHIETLANEADRKLLKSISQCPSHVLRHLLIEKPTSGRSLRVYDLGLITLPFLQKIIGIFYLGPFIKLSVPHRVMHIA